ncbi:MAG: hypothetical protein ACT4OP_07940 [Actinomycetota bacterium]
MNAMLFAYVEARQAEIELALRQRHVADDAPSVRDRLGRALISIGEHLVTVPLRVNQEARPAA